MPPTNTVLPLIQSREPGRHRHAVVADAGVGTTAACLGKDYRGAACGGATPGPRLRVPHGGICVACRGVTAGRGATCVIAAH